MNYKYDNYLVTQMILKNFVPGPLYATDPVTKGFFWSP